jgi:hypothetical protein
MTAYCLALGSTDPPGANVFNLLRNYIEEVLMVDLELLAGEVRQSLAESFPVLQHNSLIFQVLPQHTRLF